ncbi:MAG: hypothetical protein HC939_20860, partial [Pleurocapsa sp. SU_5_0]|nr:hypothetical protein [Pleurocapsa sp. SU_5_0]
IAAYAFVNANNTNVIATAPATPIRGQAEEPTQPSPNRHTITLVLNQLSDLKIQEGQRISVGEVISPKGLASRPIAPPKEPNCKPKNSD